MTKHPLVFLPGLLCDEKLWQVHANALSDIADSSIADLTLDDSIPAMAQRTLAAAPEKFALAALSMGGYVAFEILRQAPDRVIRLALFDTSAAPDTPEKIAQRKAGMSSLLVGRFTGVTTRLLPRLIHRSHVDGPVGRELKAMATRVGGDAFLRQQQAILERADSRPLLTSVSVPSIVAVGDEDTLTPMACALDIHHGIAGSWLYVFRDCGHLPALEKPVETTRVLRQWLSGS